MRYTARMVAECEKPSGGRGGKRITRMAAGILALLAGAAMVFGQASRNATLATNTELGIPGTAQTENPALDPFTDLPPTKSGPHDSSMATNYFPGGPGLDPHPLQRHQSITLAVLGALAPEQTLSKEFLRSAVDQLNLLRPDFVLTTGNLIPGLTRDGKTYAGEALALQDSLAALKMPWFPCAGQTDIESGTRDPADRRFEALYQKYIGPRYYAFTAGDLHVIVLDSETAGNAGESGGGGGGGGWGGGIDDVQYHWLEADLDRAFAGDSAGPPRWVIVLLHRPLWRVDQPHGDPHADGWKRVHTLLADFNRRPVVNVEGMGGGGPVSSGTAAPRVVAVIAGSERAYSLDPTRDGIRYYSLGPTAAAPHDGESDSEALRQIFLLKFDPSSAEPSAAQMHALVIPLGDAHPPDSTPTAILPDDVFTLRERQEIDTIAAWGNDGVGVEGSMDLPAPISSPSENIPATAPAAAPISPPPRKMTLHILNPLADPIDIQLRLASTQFLASAQERESVDLGTEGMDLPWELNASHLIRHISPGGKDTISFTIARPDDAEEVVSGAPPELEIVVHWADPRGRTHAVVLKRRVTTVPAIKVPVTREFVRLVNDDGWKDAASGEAYAWDFGAAQANRPPGLNPLWQITADAANLYVRVRAEDHTPSYWPNMTLGPAPGEGGGRIASDAVVLAWAKSPGPNPAIARVWLLPYAPEGAQLWTNTSMGSSTGSSAGTATAPGEKQSELLKLSPDTGIRAYVEKHDGGYTATLSLPRKIICTAGTAGAFSRALLNISVMDNDAGPHTWSRSWANPDADPTNWGPIEITAK